MYRRQLMFLLLALLEDSGYMARAAVVADRAMRAMGLPGLSLIHISEPTRPY